MGRSAQKRLDPALSELKRRNKHEKEQITPTPQEKEVEIQKEEKKKENDLECELQGKSKIRKTERRKETHIPDPHMPVTFCFSSR